MRASLTSFLRDVLSVILGIAITFTVQGIIDRSRDRKDVRSALELVRTELLSNRADILLVRDYLLQERSSAMYFVAHGASLADCPADSILYHSGMLLADVSIALSQDALELLKSSSLFQKMGNTRLSMDIIRAYDTCELLVGSVKHHLSARDARFDGAITEQTAGRFSAAGSLSIPEFIKTEYGRYAVQWLTVQPESSSSIDVSDIDRAVTSIDTYLQRRGRSSRDSKKSNP